MIILVGKICEINISMLTHVIVEYSAGIHPIDAIFGIDDQVVKDLVVANF